MFFLKSSVFCLLAASSIAFLASAQSKQVDFPLPDSLPDPSPSQIESIQMRAGGTLPNTPPPMRISSEGINNLKLMAFTGLSEVAFFDELLRNITTSMPGYQVANAQERDIVIKSLTTLLAVCTGFTSGESISANSSSKRNYRRSRKTMAFVVSTSTPSGLVVIVSLCPTTNLQLRWERLLRI